MKVGITVMGLMAALATSACSVVGIRSGTEEPRFQVVAVAGAVEVRRYGARLAAETEVDGDEVAARSAGFRRLAGFIFGGNEGRTRIAMTAPVAQAGGGGESIAMTAPVGVARVPGGGTGEGRWRIRFFMPAEYTLATLPRPRDPAVRVVEVPAQEFAVLRFTGSIAPEAVARATGELQAGLRGMAWRAVGAPVAWFYDPPWTVPFLRRNEVAVEVVADAPG